MLDTRAPSWRRLATTAKATLPDRDRDRDINTALSTLAGHLQRVKPTNIGFPCIR
jgi:hypothetical protein